MAKYSLRQKFTSGMAAFRTVWSAASRDEPVVIVEAGALDDLAAEDQNWTRLSGGGAGGLPSTAVKSYTHDQALDISLKLYQQDHMARRLIGLFADFIVGDGITVQAKHEDKNLQQEIQDHIDTFWNNPVNAMDRMNEQRIQEQYLWGEICMPIKRNDATGQIQLGWITPKAITKMLPNPATGHPGIIEVSDAAAKAVGMKRLAVVDLGAGEWVQGDCFYFPINMVRGSGRGLPELFTAVDMIQILNNTLRAHADRAKVDANFIWDVTLEGYTEEQVKKWLKAHAKKPVRPNSIRAHNEKVKWEAVSPNLGSLDFAAHIKTLKGHIMGGFGIPPHWYGTGDDANLATAAVMSEPTRKALRRKQKAAGYMIGDIIRYLLYSVQAAGNLRGLDLATKDPFEVQIPDISGPDIAKVGNAMAQITAAISMAIDNELVSKDTGMELFSAIASELGLQVNAAAERDKIEADAKDAERKDQETTAAMTAALDAALKAAGAPAGAPTGAGGDPGAGGE